MPARADVRPYKVYAGKPESGRYTKGLIFLPDMDGKYALWEQKATEDPVLAGELAAIRGDGAEIAERFYRSLAFGTGGLRGVMGAGTSRMNIYTVRQAAQGLSAYLQRHFTGPSVCIAYDTRNMSKEFALAAAQVLCANGITVRLFAAPRPTPMLSFAVRFLKASAGVVITASHNPKEYNGYKVYGADGGQITDRAAAEIAKDIAACDIFADVRKMPVKEAVSLGRLRTVGADVDEAYYRRATALAMRRGMIQNRAESLGIVYTPLNGTGLVPVCRVLKDLGFDGVRVVGEQAAPDGNFPTVPVPNPEVPGVYDLAIETAKKVGADLIFATDPDCDRIGVMASNARGGFSLLTGNQAGALLCDYIIRTKKETGTLPQNAAVIKSIVTTDLVKKICGQHGVALCEVLTGFKYIGEKMGEWERDKSQGFIFGLEESCGYLAGDFVRDKDALIAAVLLAEMALYYKERGLSLFQALEELYARYGYRYDKLISIELPGRAGEERIAGILPELQKNRRRLLSGEDLCAIEDYRRLVREETGSGRQEAISLPASDVIKLVFCDGSWLAVRPSRTEPKIKMYLSAAGGSRNEAETRLAQLEQLGQAILGQG